MTLIPFYLFSGFICLFWILVHSIFARNVRTYKIFVYLYGAIFITACGDVVMATLSGSEAVAHLVILLMAPTLIPLCCLYFVKLYRDIRYGPLLQFWIVLPAMLFATVLTLTIFNGLDNTDAFLDRLHNAANTSEPIYTNGTEHAYYILAFVTFRVVMIMEGLILIIYSGLLSREMHFQLRDLYHFLFKGQSIRVLELQIRLSLSVIVILILKILLHPYFQALPGWSIAISLAIAVLYFLFGLFALFGAKDSITLKDIQMAFRFNYGPDNASQIGEEVIMDTVSMLNGDSLSRVVSRMGIHPEPEYPGDSIERATTPSLVSAVLSSASRGRNEDGMLHKFRHLMLDEQLFLQPGLTLGDVAGRMNTNKTYVSKMVNQTYQLGFPEVLNILRVDYAQDYMSKNPAATQEEVAKASGFLSASSFNITFKRITGYTPKVWAANKALFRQQ